MGKVTDVESHRAIGHTVEHHPPQQRRRAMTSNVDLSVQQIQQDFQALIAYVLVFYDYVTV